MPPKGKGKEKRSSQDEPAAEPVVAKTKKVSEEADAGRKSREQSVDPATEQPAEDDEMGSGGEEEPEGGGEGAVAGPSAREPKVTFPVEMPATVTLALVPAHSMLMQIPDAWREDEKETDISALCLASVPLRQYGRGAHFSRLYDKDSEVHLYEVPGKPRTQHMQITRVDEAEQSVLGFFNNDYNLRTAGHHIGYGATAVMPSEAAETMRLALTRAGFTLGDKAEPILAMAAPGSPPISSPAPY